MDGTLVDSMPLWEDCGRAFLSARGITAREDLGETLKSLSMEQTADYLRDAYGISETTAEIIEMINGMVTDAYQRTIPLKRDIAAFLERLRQADVRMCVATATDRPLAILPQFFRWDVLEDLMEHPNDLPEPWYGQLMRTPQIFAYLLQIDHWFRTYDVELI